MLSIFLTLPFFLFPTPLLEEMDPDCEIESILSEIYQSRFLWKKDTNECFVCGNAGKYFRKSDFAKRFCSTTCNRIEHLASQCFQLGMKRSARAIGIGDEDFEEWRLIQFPNEIQAMIILLAFDYRIQNGKEWNQLKRIEFFVDKRHTEIIVTLVLPNLRFIHPEVLSRLGFEIVTQLKGLRKLELPRDGVVQQFWPDVMTTLNDLVDLDVSTHKGVQTIHTERLTNLVRLVCGPDTEDQNLNGLVKLQQLVLYGQNSQITDTGLSYVSNILSLEIASSRWMTMERMRITPDGLRNLNNLRRLILNNIGQNVITMEHRQALSNLAQLYLLDVDMGVDTFTNLVTLKIVSKRGLGSNALPLSSSLTKLSLKNLSSIHATHLYPCTKLVKLKLKNISVIKSVDDGLIEFFSKLSNLEKLDISKNQDYGEAIKNKHVSLLVSLKSLNLDSNDKITDKGISTLTNLTTLNLRNNTMITNKSLRRLKSLRLIHENGRTYRREPDDLTFY